MCVAEMWSEKMKQKFYALSLPDNTQVVDNIDLKERYDTLYRPD